MSQHVNFVVKKDIKVGIVQLIYLIKFKLNVNSEVIKVILFVITLVNLMMKMK